MTSPTQRSLKHLREGGWSVQVVERWNPYAHVRVDLFGFGDIVAVKADGKITMVQTTSGSHVSHRIEKAKAIAGPLIAWLLAGGRLVVHGWAKRGARGEVKRWTLREVELTVKDLTEAESA